MESTQFDALVKTLTRPGSRRRVLGVVLAATGVLGGAAPAVEAARCAKHKPCPACQRCKQRRCKPDAKQDGKACAGGTCEHGTCQPAACLALQAACADATQCCQDDGALDCAPIGNLVQDQCCRPLGGACATLGAFADCCAVVFEPGVSGALVSCAPNHTCGGAGALCTIPATCASGVCCGIGLVSACCAPGSSA